MLLFWQTPAAAVAALAAVLGHCFTPWLRFRGGKGVATFLGVSVAGGVVPPLAFAGAWLAVFGATRISAIAGVTACAVAAAAAALSAVTSPGPSAVAAAAALALASLVVVARHRSNFAQMAAERRLRSAGGKP